MSCHVSMQLSEGLYSVDASDDWKSMHMAATIAAELGEDIAPATQDAIAALAAAGSGGVGGIPLEASYTETGT